MPDRANGDIDPRTEPGLIERGVEPTVRRPTGGLTTAAIVGIAVLIGLIVLVVLNQRRTTTAMPALTVPRLDDERSSAAPPPLDIPPVIEQTPPVADPQEAPPSLVAPAPIPLPPPPAPPQVVYMPAPQPSQMPMPPAAQPRNAGGQVLVIDKSRADGGASSGGGDASGARETTDSAFNPTRARAGMFANRSTTVAQGTMIPAVLETGFDSTRPGLARALVQRDVGGFDGARILIPRGSRLVGEYRSNIVQGQRRAFIGWTRLIRPDGATIEIGSPVADSLGRNGVKAKVNTHFFERFSGAILQSVLNVGANLAQSQIDRGVVVALPGSFGGATSAIAQPTQIPPTLSVAPGTSVTVFVARDLDFSDVSPRE